MLPAVAPLPPSELLEIDDLRVTFPGSRRPGGRPIAAVRGVSFAIGRGEIVGLVGESGSGKSLTALSILGLAPRNARVSGQIRLGPEGEDLLTLGPRRSEEVLRQVRGGRVGMIFQ